MRVLHHLWIVLVIGVLAAAGPAGASDRGSLAGKVFLVEATILSSPFFPEYEGAIFPSCFTFEADGTWIDFEWPGEGLDPIPGKWIQHSEVPFVRFSAFATWPATGWKLVENGLASRGESEGKGQLTAFGMVFSETDELVFYVTTVGHAVDSCPL